MPTKQQNDNKVPIMISIFVPNITTMIFKIDPSCVKQSDFSQI